MNVSERTVDRFTWIIHAFACIALAGLFAFYAIHKIEGIDIWIHLICGKYIVQHLSVPQVDIFSYVIEGRPWINHEWLMQIIYYGVYVLDNIRGLIVLNALVLGTSFFLALRIGGFHRMFILKWLLLVCAFMVAKIHFPIRPQSFSLLFIAIYLLIFWAFRRGKWRGIYALPVLQLLWVNIHGYYIIGPLMVVLFIIGEWIQNTFPILEWDQRGAVDNAHLKRLLVITLIMLGAGFCTPSGLEGFLYPFKVITQMQDKGEFYRAFVTELYPLFDVFVGAGSDRSHVGHLCYLLIGISAGSFIANVRRLRLSDFFIYVVFFYMLIGMIRHVGFFVLIAVYMTLFNACDIRSLGRWQHLGHQLQKRRMRHFSSYIVLCMSVVLVLMTVISIRAELYQATGRPPRLGFGVMEMMDMTDAINFLEDNDITGNIYNTGSSASYLLWKTFPKRQVFFDMRTELYESDFYMAAMVFLSPPVWNRLVDMFDIDIVFLRHSMGGSFLLARVLEQDVRWKAVYLDPVCIIYVRNLPRFQPLIERYEVDLRSPSVAKALWEKDDIFDRVYPWRAEQLGIFYTEIGMLDIALTAYQYALALRPDGASAQNNLGVVLLQQGKYAAAQKHLAQALRLVPSQRGVKKNLSQAQEWQVDYDQKIKMIEELCREYTDKEQVSTFRMRLYFQHKLFYDVIAYGRTLPEEEMSIEMFHILGLTYFSLGDYRMAYDFLKRAYTADPASLHITADYASALGMIGRHDESRQLLQALRAAHPDFTKAWYNLGITVVNTGNFEEAITIWEELLRRDPGNKYAAREIRKARRMLKRFEVLDSLAVRFRTKKELCGE